MATEEEEERPARKVRRITRLQVHEGSLVDNPANELCRVVLWKRDQDEDGDEVEFEADEAFEQEVMKAMQMDGDQIERRMKRRCRELAPSLSYEQALAKHLWDDPELVFLYGQSETAPAPAPVAKSVKLPGAGAWSVIEKRAEAERRPNETLPAAIARLLEDEPELYTAYLAETG